jgi:hypothetical protein
MRILMHNNQNGMVLVLAMFMIALLSMIGVASMMTSTTDTEIATGERLYVETFYRTQAAHTITGELLQLAMWDRGLTDDADTIDTNGDMVNFEEIDDYTFAFRLIDPDMLLEDPDSVEKTITSGLVWDVDEQEIDELPCPDDMTASECKALDAKIGTEDLDLWTDIRIVGMQDGQEIVLADIDVDKVRVDPMSGGGAQFGSKDLGIGAQVSIITYNLDARSRLSTGDFNKSPSRQALGFRIVK